MSLRLLGKNTAIYAIGNVGTRAAAFLLLPLYTHCLSVKDYGLLATLLISVELMVVFMSAGTRDSLIRLFHEYESKNRIGTLLGTSILINVAAGFAVALACALFLMPFFRTTLHADDIGIYIALSCSMALAQSLCLLIMSYFRARNESTRFMIIALCSTFLSIGLNLLLVRGFHLGIKGVLIAQTATYGAIFLLVSLSIFPTTGINVSFPLILAILRFTSPLVVSMACESVMESSSLYFLSRFSGLEHVAIYSLGFKFASIVSVILLLPFEYAFPPFVFANIGKPGTRRTISRALTYLVIGSAFAVLLVSSASRLLIPLCAPPEYSRCYVVLLLLLPAFVFMGLGAFGKTLLHINKKSYITGSVAASFAVLNLILNYVLVPRYGFYGSIIATDVTLMLAGLATFALGLREYPVPFEKKRLLISSGLLIFFLLALLVSQDATPMLFRTAILFSAGLAVVFLVRSRFFYHEEIRAIRNLILRLRQMKRAV